MMKLFLYSLLTWFLVVLSGCTFDPSYEAEKAYWEARELIRKLQKDSPNELEEEHYEQIIEALNRVSDAAPFEPIAARAQFQIAQIYYGLEKTEQAHDVLKETFFRFTNSENKNDSSSEDIAAQAAFWNGRLYEVDGDIEKAHEEYKIVMEQFPLTNLGLQTPLYIVQYYKNKGDVSKLKEVSAEAHSHYQKLMDKYSGTPIEEQVKLYSLRVYVQEEAWQDILNFFDSESKTRVERSEILQARIAKADILASRMEKTPEAIAIYRDIIEKFPFEPVTPLLRIQLGRLLSAGGNPEEARETFQEILNDFPENKELTIQSRIGLATVDVKEGKYEEAIKAYEALFAKYPNHPTTLKIPFVKYVHYKKSGREEGEVMQALEAAMAEYSSRWERGGSDETDKIAGRLLFLGMVQKKDWDTAATHLNSLVERFPNDPDFLQLSKAIYQKGSDNSAKALQIFFDSSSDSPFFQSEDSPLQDIEEPFEDALEQQ